MSNQSTNPAFELQPVDPVYLLRDVIAGHFTPMTPYERKLVTRYAVTMDRYEMALDMERRAFSRTGPLEMMENEPEKFKMISRYVAECERANRRALEELRRIIRERKKSLASPDARKPWNRLDEKLPPDPPRQGLFQTVVRIPVNRKE